MLLLLACLVAPGASHAKAAPTRVAIFFYPWYGTPLVDGDFHHWQRRGSTPPVAIASAFYPARGLYSSGDALVLDAQMREIAAAGVDQVVTSWWGWGSLEDVRLPAIMRAAGAVGLTVAIHLEPYAGRTPASTSSDIQHLRQLGVTDFYLYAPSADGLPWDWAAMNASLEGVRILAQTGHVGYAKRWGFDGVYTYDIVTYGGQAFGRLCAQARRQGLICAPSVGPGFDARWAIEDSRVKPRRNGGTYDAMWQAALRAGADLITITSYNEWHEGSQIEPARAVGPYRGYEGAWGRVGRAAERAYLERTAYWSARFTARGPRAQAARAARRVRLPLTGSRP
jgi:glycoprotein endo-alpha-1,2-mannosidase